MKNDKDLLIQVKNLTKNFPGVKALDDVNLNFYSREVHAIIGENGAGKSTLMKILSGVYQIDKGEVCYLGKKVNFSNPLQAKEAGITIIYQELSLIPQVSVVENIYLGSLKVKKCKIVDWKKLKETSRQILKKLEFPYPETEIVTNLSTAHQKMVEIARALALEAKVIIFDEPTAALTEEDTKILFRNINYLKNNNVGIIYISHRLEEIFEIADYISILRDGKKIDSLEVSGTSMSYIIKKMTGRSIGDYFGKTDKKIIPENILEVKGLCKKSLYNDISFKIRKGEIVGLYGLIGSGRSEIAESIFGIRKPDSGIIYVDGKEKKVRSPVDAISLGMGFVPEDRRDQGLFLELSTNENLVSAKIRFLHKFGLISKKSFNTIYYYYKDKLSIAAVSPDQIIEFLSGGNQQKLIIARWMSLNPRIFILDEPTSGIDVGSKSEVHKLILDMARNGVGVLLISSEILEVVNICDKVITIHEGSVTGVFYGDNITEKDLYEAIQ